MAEFIVDKDDDEGFGVCSECGVYFEVVFNLNPIYDRIEYCPFCGSEFE